MGGEAYIAFKPDLIDAQGNVTDDSVRTFLKNFIDQFAAFAGSFASTRAAASGLDTKEKTHVHPTRQTHRAVASPPWRAPASSCAAPSASAKRPRPIRSCCSTISATTTRRIISPASPGIRTAASKPSPTFLNGTVEHGDSLGNRGTLGSGDVQWMTAGRGIMHQEMPQGDAQGRMHGFQLWANLPSSLKMTAPRYQDVKGAEIPEITDDDGTHVRVVCGEFWGKRGPVEGVAADPRYLDVFVPAGQAQDAQGRNRAPRLRLRVRRRRQVRLCLEAVRRAQRKAGRRRGDPVPRAGRRPLAGAVRPRRRGHRAGRRQGHPLPAGVRQADRGAGRLVRADRDEHAGRTATGGLRTAQRHVHQEAERAAAQGARRLASPSAALRSKKSNEQLVAASCISAAASSRRRCNRSYSARKNVDSHLRRGLFGPAHARDQIVRLDLAEKQPDQRPRPGVAVERLRVAAQFRRVVLAQAGARHEAHEHRIE